MAVLEPFVEAEHVGIVERVAVLVDLKDVGIVVEFGGTDGERNEHADAVLLGEVAQVLHLLGVQRTDDEVAVSSGRVFQRLADIAVLSHIPRPYAGRHAGSPQAVAGHQHTTVILQHALAVAVLRVQGQHDTHANLALAHVHLGRLGCHCRRCRGCSRCLPLGVGNVDHGAFLELIARCVHLGVGVDEFLYGQPVFAGYAEDGLLALYLMAFLEHLHLCKGRLSDQ